MVKGKKRHKGEGMRRLKNYFISGAVIFLPLALTINLFLLLFNFADSIFGRYLEPYFDKTFGFYFRGLSILICLLIIVLIGFVASNYLGRRFFPHMEEALLRLPFFKQVYPAIKEIFRFFLNPDEKKLVFKRVVLVEYPRKGVYAVAFLTSDAHPKVSEKLGEEMCNVFIPSTPSPLTGFAYIVPRKDLIYPDITVEDAVRFIASGGVLN